jgi:hypothetical protein
MFIATDAAKATLANMHRAAPWVWMHYARNGCYHHAPKGAPLSVPSCGPGCGDAPFPAQGCPM